MEIWKRKSAALTLLSKLLPTVEKNGLLPQKQQAITYTLYYLTLVAGIIANLTGITGPQKMEAHIMNAVLAVIILSLIITNRIGRLSLSHTFCAMTITAQLFTCGEMIFCAISPSRYGLMLIIGNMVLLAANMMFSLIAYLHNTSYFLGGMTIATYVACVIITGDDILKNFCILYIVMFIAIAVLGTLLVRNINRLYEENITMKMEEEAIFHTLKLEKKEVLAYIGLAKQRRNIAETNNILDRLSEKSRENVIRNVNEAMLSKELRLRQLSDTFPELSPSEIEICRLVIMGKTLNEVCNLLNKSEGNVTSQRSNIRKKLGLQPADNLKKVLQDRFNNGKND